MKPLRFTDSGVTLGGRIELPMGAECSTVSEITGTMEHCSIDKALVRHAAGRDHEPLLGNEMLLEAISKTDHLEPIATLCPLSFLRPDGRTDDSVLAREYLSQHRFRGAAIYPSSTNHNYSVAEWCFGPVLRTLEEMKMPLYVELAEIGAEALADLLAAHHALRVVVGSIYYGADRVLFPLLDRYDRLYLESSLDRQYTGLEDYVRRFGAERIVFGSCYPASSMGAAVTSVVMSSLSDEEKQLIASGNAERLLEEIEYAS